MNYYNEYDPYAAQWLRNLINAGLIPAGYVDERPIQEVKSYELREYMQCHFFAGIGGWPLALSLAGWPSDRPVWTGSCPCQPFSVAGKRKGTADERHLWPVWFGNLIRECRSGVVFGEQVASKDGLEWFAGVQADLEAEGYRANAVDLCAAGVAAPHIRQRLFWVADSQRPGFQGRLSGWENTEREGQHGHTGRSGSDSGISDPERNRNERITGNGSGAESASSCGREAYAGTNEVGDDSTNPWTRYILVPCADGKARRIEPGLMPLAHGVPGRVGKIRAFGNAIVPQIAAEFIKAYMSV